MPARPAAGPGSGRIDSNSTAAASTALVETGVSRSPVTHRSYTSIATVSSACTQRSVTGSIANTSSRVVSSSTYSPGRIARSRPYGVAGRPAISRLAFVPPNADVPLLTSRSSARARVGFGTRTTSSPCSASSRAATSARIRSWVGLLAPVCAASTRRTISSQRASAPASGSFLRCLRWSASPSGPSASNRQIIRRTVITDTPSSAAFAW